MINHARTLLLNKHRRRFHYSDIGYEYVPPEFKPVELTSTLSLVQQFLFGAVPDNYFLHYRCRELLSYIHTTELAEYIYRLDPRVTYWPEINKPFFEPTSKRVSITQTYGQPQSFTVTGDLKSINSLGHAYNQYTIDLTKTPDPTDTALQLKLQTVGRNSTTIVETISKFSDPPILTLPNTDVKLRLSLRVDPPRNLIIADEKGHQLGEEAGGSACCLVANAPRRKLIEEQPSITRVITDDDALTFIQTYAAAENNTSTDLLARWFVETKVTPDPVLVSAVSSIETIGEPVLIELFGLQNDEPYLTFKNLWFDHPLPTYRLSGIVLALIYRTEELRS